VLASSDCDLGLVGFEMVNLVKRLGAMLTPEIRSELQGSIGF
jgi:hypothetical protein